MALDCLQSWPLHFSKVRQVTPRVPQGSQGPGENCSGTATTWPTLFHLGSDPVGGPLLSPDSFWGDYFGHILGTFGYRSEGTFSNTTFLTQLYYIKSAILGIIGYRLFQQRRHLV